jgi:adenine-specific DNA-methyltransferase
VDGNGNAEGNFPARMLEVLRKSPVLRLEGNKAVTLENVRPPAKSLVLSAEAMLKNGEAKPVAFVFGPENGPVAERLVNEALREAYMKAFAQLFVIGFAVQPSARLLIDQSAAMGSVPAVYVQATPDLLMGDLLKTMRSSQIFSVCGLPEIEVKRLKSNGAKRNGAKRYQVKLVGLDVFDPVTMDNINLSGAEVPAWFLDTNYNEKVFHVSQAFFPRTSAWDHLKKALRGTHEETVWNHLAGTTSAPFEAGDQRRISVKVIDDRGNELQVVKPLD